MIKGYKSSVTYSVVMFLNCQNPGSVPAATNSRLSPLKPEPVDYNYGFGATVDIPLDSSTVCIKLRLMKSSVLFLFLICCCKY